MKREINEKSNANSLRPPTLGSRAIRYGVEPMDRKINLSNNALN